ncbi:MAG: thrombospondin type 3 repeat-containing protein [Gammaproteobacteria bacterium]
MWKSIALLVLGITGLMAAVNFNSDSGHPATVPDANAPKLRPGEWLDIRRLQGSEISPNQRARVSAQLALRKEQNQRSGGQWTFRGPDNIGGRVVDLVVDPAIADTVYAASASGGVWRSNNAGDTFVSVWPNDSAQSMGALAMSSTGILYAGTGESNPGGGSLTYGNAGVFSSSDGGANWTPLGLENTERISRIVVDSANPDRLFVAATGPLYNEGGERGVYRSLNGGATWELSLAGDNLTTGASDIVIDPENPDRLYAAMWDHLRQPALRRYGGEGSGIYRSDDGGDSWSRLGPANNLPAPDADVGRVSIGLAPSDSSVLYALYLTTRGFFQNAYTSTDGGTTWSALPFDTNLASSQSSFGWWFARIWVDPADASHVFVAGLPLSESTDGGVTFTNQTSIHADQHAMAWDPNVPGRVYLGNDGGVYRSETNGSAPWVFATKQPFTQFYTLDVSENDGSRIVGGTQDNRCLRSYDNAGNALWNRHGQCGDGLENLINPQNQDIVYSCSQYGFCGVSFDGGATSGPIGAVASSRRNWQTPLVFYPSNPSSMIYAGNLVEKSTDGGLSWSTISPDLTGGDPFPSPIDPYPFGTVTTVAVAPGANDKIMIGTDGGRVWRYDGFSWTQITAPNLPNRWVSKLLIDPLSLGDAVYLSYSGFRDADDTPYVFYTSDFGDTWTDISTNLPSAPVNTLATTDSGQLVAGTDVGVFIQGFDGDWTTYGDLPLVPVTDLRTSPSDGALLAATFGRGIWSIQTFIIDPSDTDGIPDGQDNCTFVNNADQTDVDNDGIGNACDADFDQNCIVNFLDYSLFIDAFLSSDPLFDLNGDGTVNFLDLITVSNSFLQPPGPSATPCVPN